MFHIKHILPLKWFAIISMAVVSWQLYQHFRPEPAELDEPRKLVAEEACWAMVKRLPSPTGPRKLVVMPLIDDENGYITTKLRQIIGRSGGFHVANDSLIVNVMKELGFREKPSGDLDAAIAAARKTDAQYLLDGKLHSFTSDRSQGRISLTATLYRTADSSRVGEPIRIDLPASPQTAGFMKGASLLLVWLLAIIGLPVVLYKEIRSALAAESNGITLAVLLVLSVFGSLLAWGISGFALNAFVLVGAFALAVGVNYGMLNWIENHR